MNWIYTIYMTLSFTLYTDCGHFLEKYSVLRAFKKNNLWYNLINCGQRIFVSLYIFWLLPSLTHQPFLKWILKFCGGKYNIFYLHLVAFNTGDTSKIKSIYYHVYWNFYALVLNNYFLYDPYYMSQYSQTQKITANYFHLYLQ